MKNISNISFFEKKKVYCIKKHMYSFFNIFIYQTLQKIKYIFYVVVKRNYRMRITQTTIETDDILHCQPFF